MKLSTVILVVVIAVVGVAVVGLGSVYYLLPTATYSVASRSMEPSLQLDEIVQSTAARGYCVLKSPKMGDIIVMKHNGFVYMKRLVAGPGETVQMKDGRLHLNGVPVKLTALGPDPNDTGAQRWRETLPNGKTYDILDQGSDGPFDNTAAVTVPAGHWFVLGDNRDNSADSRVPRTEGGVGFVAGDQLCGVATAIVGSRNPARRNLKL